MFSEAAQRLGVELILATDRCHVLKDPWNDRAFPIRFNEPEASLASLPRVDAIVAVGDRPAYVAALAAERFGLPFHSSLAVAAARSKFESRRRFRDAGLPVPDYFRIALDEGPGDGARRSGYPCVLKPLGLSASRGVIRADNEAEFSAAFHRIRSILERPEIARFQDPADRFVQVERFIPGREFAVEGLVTRGTFHPLAIFDKPDPLDGPFFEETIYVTPSREPESSRARILETVRRAVGALGLDHGPIHAEVRVNDEGVWVLEAAGRPIGGLCAKALRFEVGRALEELILLHALGEAPPWPPLERGASGVMMIPIPQEGIYRGVEGLDRASAFAEVEITAKEGQHFVPLPEGHSYLGFVFSKSGDAGDVEARLRQAHACLGFVFSKILPVIA
jgi:hypothetical protein